LNALLNTKCPKEAVPSGFEQCSKSLLTYGLADFTSINVNNSEEQTILRHAIQDVVTRFEPRLKAVKVIAEKSDPLLPILRFQITGLLQVEPSPELVQFDTVLHPDKALVTVEGAA
jgi:type VI secretion system protein ImpF